MRPVDLLGASELSLVLGRPRSVGGAVPDLLGREPGRHPLRFRPRSGSGVAPRDLRRTVRGRVLRVRATMRARVPAQARTTSCREALPLLTLSESEEVAIPFWTARGAPACVACSWEGACRLLAR